MWDLGLGCVWWICIAFCGDLKGDREGRELGEKREDLMWEVREKVFKK